MTAQDPRTIRSGGIQQACQDKRLRRQDSASGEARERFVAGRSSSRGVVDGVGGTGFQSRDARPVAANAPSVRTMIRWNGLSVAGELAGPRHPGIKTVPYVRRSHPVVERLIRTVRRDCLDRHTVPWTAADLERSSSSSSSTTTSIARMRTSRAPVGDDPERGRRSGESPGVSVAAALSWAGSHAEGRRTRPGESRSSCGSGERALSNQSGSRHQRRSPTCRITAWKRGSAAIDLNGGY